MHICFVSTYFPQPCGIASYVHYLIESLQSIDPSIKITLLAEEPAQEDPTRQMEVFSSFRREDDFSTSLIERIEDLHPDLVHIQHEYGIFGMDQRFLRLLRELREQGIKTIVTLHTIHTKLSFYAGCAAPYLRHILKKVDIEDYQHQLAELADVVIVHQENSIRQVLLRQGVLPPKVVTIPHGTRIVEPYNARETKKALGVEEDVPLVLAFGYLEESKNLLVLIQAFRRISKRVPRAKLWLGGYVRFPSQKALAYRERCINLIQSSGLEDSVIMSENLIPEEQVPMLLSAADVACFVYKEDTHSSSGALHLAMGLGKPVIAARISKFQELAEVSDELLVNPLSARELSQVLERLLLDTQFYSYVQRRVNSYAQATSWSCVAQQHLMLYRQFIASLALSPIYQLSAAKLEVGAMIT